MILTERFLLPPGIDDAQRRAIVHKRLRRRHGVSGRIIAIVRGEAGWIQQAGNADGTVYFGVIERRFDPPSLPQRNHWRKSW
jgi:hypothetical protein